MAELDQRLTRLVDTLLESSMAPLIESALARLRWAESERLGTEEEVDPFAPSPDETPDERAVRQMNLLDKEITGRVKLELDLLDQSLELTRALQASLGTLRGTAREGSFATVLVVEPGADFEESDEKLTGEDLLTDARRNGLTQFLNAWNKAVELTRRSIEVRPEGQRGD